MTLDRDGAAPHGAGDTAREGVGGGASTVGVGLATALSSGQAAISRLPYLADRRFDALSIVTGQIVWTTDGDGRVDDVPSWRAYTGQSRKDVRGVGWVRAVHPDDRERARAAWEGAVRTGEPYQVEYRLRRHDGVYRWFLARGAPVRDLAGNVAEWVGMSSDIHEGVDLERELRRREAEFRQLADAMPQIVWTALPGGALDYFNQSWYAYTGLTPEESFDWGWELVLHRDDYDRTLARWREALRTGEPYEIESRLRRASDGAFRWHLGRAFPVRDDTGCVVKWFGTCTDVDDQKRAVVGLELASTRTATILETISDTFFVLDPEWRFTYVNHEAGRLFQKARDQLLGRSVWDVFPEAVGSILDDELHRALREQVSVAFEAHFPPLASWFEVRAYPGPGCLSVYFRKVNDRHVADEERRQVARRAQDALNALLQMAEEVMDTRSSVEDRRGYRRPLSRLARCAVDVLGYPRAAVYALDGPGAILRPISVAGFDQSLERRWWRLHASRTIPLGDCVAPEVYARLASGGVAVIAARARSLGGERTILNPSERGPMLAAPLCVSGELVGLLAAEPGGVGHRFTPSELDFASGVARLLALALERERLVREREDARSRELAAVEATRRMDEFLSIAGHEMRTPLTVIKTNAQLLARGGGSAARTAPNFGLSEAQTRMLGRMTLATDRLNRLVADLLDASRIREGKLQFEMAPCDITALVSEAVEEQRQADPERDVVLDILPSGRLIACADPGRVSQVLINYLTNALKYSPPEAPVHVSIERVAGNDGAVAQIAVRDAGPGITADAQVHIWERFYRAPRVEVLSGSGVGLGLGLYISREIVERHGGAVGVESAPGEGSTFWFTLPLAADVAE